MEAYRYEVTLGNPGESVTKLLLVNSSIKFRDPVFDSPAQEAVLVLSVDHR